jgi:hypothetical protein
MVISRQKTKLFLLFEDFSAELDRWKNKWWWQTNEFESWKRRKALLILEVYYADVQFRILTIERVKVQFSLFIRYFVAEASQLSIMFCCMLYNVFYDFLVRYFNKKTQKYIISTTKFFYPLSVSVIRQNPDAGYYPA